MSVDLDGHAAEVAPLLLGAIFTGPNGSGRIVEVEAYGGADDEASHAFGGPTARNAPMFGPSGTLYVYLIYGIHHCANIVTGAVGDGQAVLIRALEPVGDRSAMESARPVRRETDLTKGPGNLCRALGIDRGHSGLDLLDGSEPVSLRTAPLADSEVVENSIRIGITRARSRRWRWYLVDNPWVSQPR